jgi:DNA polymerase I
MILNGQSKEEVISFLQNIYDKIVSREIPDEEIGFPMRIQFEFEKYKAIGPMIKGVKYSNKYLGTHFEKGAKPKYIYIKSVAPGYPDTKVVAFDEKLPSGFVPDWDKMTDRILKMKLSEIFKSVGWGEFPKFENRTVGLGAWGVK